MFYIEVEKIVVVINFVDFCDGIVLFVCVIELWIVKGKWVVKGSF